MLENNNKNLEKQVTHFAKTNYRNQNVKFGIKLEDRRRHMYVVGKTGVGKTELLKNLAVQDFENNHGMAYVDPNGDAVEELLEAIPTHRINDVVYYNPADTAYPIAFNILESVDPEYKHLVADGLMAVFTKIWANMWSSRMEYILRNCILALLEVPGNTLLGITRLLSDKNFRKKIVSKVKDPVVRSFWIDEYANYNDRYRTEAIAPIQNKVGQFLSSSIIRNIVGQPRSTIDPREIMDNGKILLMNLSKGKIGEDNSALLGAMMITKIQLAAMSRANIPESERRDFFLYVDEFQNFATESFADILSEARKYHLGLIMGHQYIAQLTTSDTTKVRDAVFGNVGTLVCFRIGAADAEYLLKEFEPHVTEEDLVNLNKYDIYLKLLIDGVSSRPFSATTLPPMTDERANFKNMEKVIKVSRERYARPKEEVENKIVRWLDVDDVFKAQAKSSQANQRETMYKKSYAEGKPKKDSSDQVSGQESKNNQQKETSTKDDKLQAICEKCGEKTRLSFVPKPGLNIFCKKCLKDFKAGQIDLKQLKFASANDKLKQVTPKQKQEQPQEKDNSVKKESQPSSNEQAKADSNQAQDQKNQDYNNHKKNHSLAEQGKDNQNIQQADGAKTPNQPQEVSLSNLAEDRTVSFKSSHGRGVKPGQRIKL